MCALCTEVLKGKITFKEVNNALREFTIPEEHEQDFQTVLDTMFKQDPDYIKLYPNKNDGPDWSWL